MGNAERMRSYRRRSKLGLTVVPVPIHSGEINILKRLGFIREGLGVSTEAGVAAFVFAALKVMKGDMIPDHVVESALKKGIERTAL